MAQTVVLMRTAKAGYSVGEIIIHKEDDVPLTGPGYADFKILKSISTVKELNEKLPAGSEVKALLDSFSKEKLEEKSTLVTLKEMLENVSYAKPLTRAQDDVTAIQGLLSKAQTKVAEVQKLIADKPVKEISEIIKV